MFKRKFAKKRVLNLFVGFSIVILAVSILIAAVQTWGTAQLFTGAVLSSEPVFWMSENVWNIVVTGVVLLLVILWLTLAFSFIALVSSLCITAALIMIFAGFSLLWPVLLLLIATWGVSQASQID
ncbi:hypothetical protein HWQ46_23960 [Shewanella sp. D64]|uniref:hypothetical protein n=1 Tax=unclassified Shewanella TaxID=196818 RepID=UPI0022BA6DA7|nr:MULTISPECIES: hypothetical protein [unclassified Shewanella]MEC4728580.1 hypothetical protein [Shewanella sp. D64]WBJ94819.1 hypothetical protein HWQ47_23730 [Shewanella sp. MTB7]